MINKNNRVYIRDWFNNETEFNEGDTVNFEMPSFCSGEYTAMVYLDNDNDPYIKKSDDYSDGCRDYFLIKKEEYEDN